jgi:Ca2+:H+ antiporter
MPRWLYFLLIFAVLAPILDAFHIPPLALFAIAALGIIPLAALIGQAVEDIAEYTGEQVGGILFATFGNATELIISIFALLQGLTDVVRASIIGSILGNALLVLGVAVCVGGFKHGRLRFETRSAGQYASLLALCIGGLVLPTIADLHITATQPSRIVEDELSDFIAIVLLLGYVASILFSVFRIGDRGAEDAEDKEDLDPVLGARSEAAIMRLLAYRSRVARAATPGKSGVLRQIDGAIDALVAQDPEASAKAAPPTEPVSSPPAQQQSERQPQRQAQARRPPLWRGLVLLAVATVGVAILSEVLVSAIEPVAHSLGWNEAFVGLVFVPLIGGLPEYFNTISMALDKRIGMVLAASAGSSIQIALLMAPILVLVSLLTPQRLDLVFSIVELAVLALATFLFSEITKDGELVWLEGLLLILLYGMMAGTIFLFGG